MFFSSQVEPYLPYEYTNQGMMERLYMFTKHHDFCESRMGDVTIPKWPPISARQIFIGDKDMGCDEVCAKQSNYLIIYSCLSYYFENSLFFKFITHHNKFVLRYHQLG